MVDICCVFDESDSEIMRSENSALPFTRADTNNASSAQPAANPTGHMRLNRRLLNEEIRDEEFADDEFDADLSTVEPPERPLLVNMTTTRNNAMAPPAKTTICTPATSGANNVTESPATASMVAMSAIAECKGFLRVITT